MSKFNLTGQRYGKLSIIEKVEGPNWRCVCDCGNEIIKRGTDIRALKNLHCGCSPGKRVPPLIIPSAAKYAEADALAFESLHKSQRRNHASKVVGQR